MTPLEQLAFMLGSWRVEGSMHGQPASGSAQAERALGGSAIIYRELLEDYEDLCVYRLDDAKELEVHHFSKDGVFRHAVHSMDDGRGFHWVPNTVFGPIVRLFPTPEGFRIEVAHRDASLPEVVLHLSR